MPESLMTPRKPKVVIIGAGFAGLYAAKSLARVEACITVVDRHNYHLFQPLLYQVAIAGLAPSDVAWPIRSILSRQDNVNVRLGEVRAIALDNSVVQVDDTEIAFDFLVVATGVTHAYFGHPEWASFAPGLKTIDDATDIRRRVLLAFERAETTPAPVERERLMRFVVVGAGPTGVELAGTIAELARYTLSRDFRSIDPASAKVVLIEAGERVLPAFRATSSTYTLKELERLGVEVRLGNPVTDCTANGVVVNGQTINAATILWAAGVAATPVGAWLDSEIDRNGRVVVARDLSIADHSNVFVIGDAARVKDRHGNPVPGIAPAAKQQGRFVASVIAARLKGQPALRTFVYRHAGNLATIGRKRAIIEFAGFDVRGWPAWCLWGVAHIYFLIGVPSPLIVALRWAWEYVTYGRGARLITGYKQGYDTPESR